MQLFGVDATSLIAATDAHAIVRLADGRAATLPAASDLYAEALTLPAEPPPVPTVVTNAQARAALRAAGLLPAVQSAINSSSPDIQDAWEYSPTLHRDSVLLAALGAQLGLTEAQIDALFVAAAHIQF